MRDLIIILNMFVNVYNLLNVNYEHLEERKMKNIQEHIDVLLANTNNFYCFFDETCYTIKGLEKEYLITSEIHPHFDLQVDCKIEGVFKNIFFYNEKSGWAESGGNVLSKKESEMLVEFMLKVKPVILSAYGI